MNDTRTVQPVGLKVRGLSVTPVARRNSSGVSKARLLDEVSVTVQPSSRLGIVGSSGAGKSMFIRAVTGFLPDGSVVAEGTVVLAVDGREHTIDPGAFAAADRTAVASAVTVIWQNSIGGLNPCRTVGRQLTDTLRLHEQTLTRRGAAEQALAWVERVGIADPRRVVRRYPHELSGGMRQRISIALGLCGGQGLIVADEPTTALDTLRQRQCLDLLAEICEEDSRSLIFVSHDLAVVAQMCDEMAVLDNGRIVEAGKTRYLLASPSSPATARIVEQARRLSEALDG